jgi:hypothetical protein
MVVDAHHGVEGILLHRSHNDHLAGAALELAGNSLRHLELSGALDHDVNAEI